MHILGDKEYLELSSEFRSDNYTDSIEIDILYTHLHIE